MKHYLSMGFGVNSVALYLLMEGLGMEFEAVFVDHGGDWPETYEYAEYFIGTGRPVTVLKPECYRKKQGVTYNNLYEYCWEKKLFPSVVRRWCTKDFKVMPVNRYIDKPCYMHLGIDAGEAKRARINASQGVESRWLLIEHDLDRDGCEGLIKSKGLLVPPKSGCWFCPYQRVAQWRKLRRRHPDLYCKARALEERGMLARVARNKEPLSLRGDGVTLARLINENQKALPGMEDLEFPPCNCGL